MGFWGYLRELSLYFSLIASARATTTDLLTGMPNVEPGKDCGIICTYQAANDALILQHLYLENILATAETADRSDDSQKFIEVTKPFCLETPEHSECLNAMRAQVASINVDIQNAILQNEVSIEKLKVDPKLAMLYVDKKNRVRITSWIPTGKEIEARFKAAKADGKIPKTITPKDRKQYFETLVVPKKFEKEILFTTEGEGGAARPKIQRVGNTPYGDKEYDLKRGKQFSEILDPYHQRVISRLEVQMTQKKGVVDPALSTPSFAEKLNLSQQNALREARSLMMDSAINGKNTAGATPANDPAKTKAEKDESPELALSLPKIALPKVAPRLTETKVKDAAERTPSSHYGLDEDFDFPGRGDQSLHMEPADVRKSVDAEIESLSPINPKTKP